MSKRSHQLFVYLVQIAENIAASTKMFESELEQSSDFESLATKMQACEEQCDDLISQLISLLNDTYITPIEREDFMTLAVRMDDIIDGINACTVRFTLYGVTQSTPAMLEFASNIRHSAEVITDAVQKLDEREFAAVRTNIQMLNTLEREGDQLLHKALKALFAEHTDALEVIKLKEVYEILEAVTDRCEDVASALEAVVLKNA